MSEANEMLQEAIKKNKGCDAFEDLDSYSSVMTISQIVKYFDRHGMSSFTKTMIQNYVRVNVLPQPEDKRHYTKNHLFTLAMIDGLKNAFSLEEIKALFELQDAENTAGFENRRKLYLSFLNEYNKAAAEIPADIEPDLQLPELVLKLMAKSVSYKQLAQSLMDV